MTDTDIHSCGYYCDRPACVKAQRNELRDKFISTILTPTPLEPEPMIDGWPLYSGLPQPEPEPVAWISHNAGLYHGKPDESLNPLPLYTTPPQREWVGLTDEEVSQMEKDCLWGGKDFNGNLGYWAVYRAIEAKLKEKNA